MGQIEDTIYKNYKFALSEGNIDQAKKAVALAKELKNKTEIEGFLDYPSDNGVTIPIIGKLFEPFPYRYYEQEGVVVIGNSAIHLTNSENKLFYLFSQNETYADTIRLVTKDIIKNYLWQNAEVSYNSVRIAILRLRTKIEHDFKNPQLIIGIYARGYIFLGKRIYDTA